MNTVQALSQLSTAVESAGITEETKDFEKVISVFESFTKVDVESMRESLLFQCGVFALITDEELFYLDLVRQFEIEEDGDYDRTEQIHLELVFEPVEAVAGIEETVWDFEMVGVKFFDYLRGRDTLRVPFEKAELREVNVYIEEVD